MTPNREEEAVKDYQKLAQGDGGNRFVVLSCPWCGIDMGPREYGREIRAFGYRLERDAGGRRRFEFRCEDPACDFSQAAGLPLTVIDEAIYAAPPTLLIGTVDKFAMLPWIPDSRAIFGIDNAASPVARFRVFTEERHRDRTGWLGMEDCPLAVRSGMSGRRFPPLVLREDRRLQRTSARATRTDGRESHKFIGSAGADFQEAAQAGVRIREAAHIREAVDSKAPRSPNIYDHMDLDGNLADTTRTRSARVRRETK